MSANIIQADYEALEQVAARFAAQAEIVQQQQQRITRQVAVLEGGGWQGRGIQAFSNEMRGEVFPAVERLHLALAEAQQVTLAVSATVRAAEEEARALFKLDPTSMNESNVLSPTPPTQPTGHEKTIYDLRSQILEAAQQYNVDPSLVGAILRDEIERRNLVDRIQNIEAQFIIAYEGGLESFEVMGVEFFTREAIENHSFGLAQMNVGTVQSLVDAGYIQAPDGWGDDKLDKSLSMLLDDDMAPTLIAARLKQTIDHWAAGGVDITNRPEILATLYPLGLTGRQGIHAQPNLSSRGEQTNDYRDRISEILSMP